MPITEVLRAPFKRDSKPQELLRVPNALPTVGMIFSGFVGDKRNTLRAFTGILSAHEAFQKSDSFPSFLEEFTQIVAGGDFTVWHVEFEPSLAAKRKAQSASVTEVVTFYFEGKPPANFVKEAFAFREVLGRQPGFVELAVGTTHEEISFEGNQKGYPLVALVGWENEQSWRIFANSDEYKEKDPGRSLEEGVLRRFEMEIVELQRFGE